MHGCLCFIDTWIAGVGKEPTSLGGKLPFCACSTLLLLPTAVGHPPTLTMLNLVVGRWVG